MKHANYRWIAAATALAVAMPAYAAVQQPTAPAPAVLPPPSAPAAPAPKILVIDRNQILRLSSVGKDILAQLEALSKQAEAEFKGQEVALRTEAATLQQQSAILSPE